LAALKTVALLSAEHADVDVYSREAKSSVSITDSWRGGADPFATRLQIETKVPGFGIVTLEIELDDSTRDRLGAVLSPCE
jgi:hypothetical protein